MTEPFWVSQAGVLRIHDLGLEIGGGAAGLRDAGLLASALARPVNLWAYGETDLFVLAAAYAEGIAGNHPFVDGNKRTGFMTADVFLARHGWLLSPVTDETHADMMVALARGQIDRGQAAAHFRDHAAPVP
ncbi:death-on-curing family protein (plasmid) [Dinoroseobacter shibae DFL 12 = DSM 16493]|uniref:Death-on-curing family protein n=1 Tax=Dinoroseobacter shibae (strain DSM 16493 / NCIMB 14021 / DFL 12) TaxID=398580 RepID=A8LUB3_DINSH|nr:type II toxin-antitoxin system death-on-curing family toxin [Dinoroseobacter shibae]ABV95830.1 death-on-curing family protein [Dinoroseobacter shibae DFL 12 = DSM 16493]URF49077.1 type II toxin-antitoxin system death-on-curing family toxin [Dinoroseobacter shibae]URF53386.1 type II toxin-antitoxin system death-on-curing family toxin [Dinoroseobacter shibae]